MYFNTKSFRKIFFETPFRCFNCFHERTSAQTYIRQQYNYKTTVFKPKLNVG